MAKQNAALGIMEWEKAMDEEELLSLEGPKFDNRINKEWGKVKTVTLAVYMRAGKILRCLKKRHENNFTRYIKDELDISKSQAYNYLNAIKYYEELVDRFSYIEKDGDFIKNPDINVDKAIGILSLSAFLELGRSDIEIQEMVLLDTTELAKTSLKGPSQREIKRYQNEYIASQSSLIPETLKDAVNQQKVKNKLGSLVAEMEQLEQPQLSLVREELEETANSPDITKDIDNITTSVKSMKKVSDGIDSLNETFDQKVDRDEVIDESYRLEITEVVASAMKTQKSIVELLTKALAAKQKLSNICERIYLETGASTPETRNLLNILEQYTNNVIEIPGIAGSSGFRVTISSLEDNFDALPV